jgi:hypothetical protein
MIKANSAKAYNDSVGLHATERLKDGDFVIPSQRHFNQAALIGTTFAPCLSAAK